MGKHTCFYLLSSLIFNYELISALEHGARAYPPHTAIARSRSFSTGLEISKNKNETNRTNVASEETDYDVSLSGSLPLQEPEAKERPFWTLTDTYVGNDFLSAFDFQAISDPTHGRVNYVNKSYALEHNLVSANFDSFVLRADHTTILDPSGLGRDSVRIQSRKSYDHHLAIFDIRHMPVGCGTWPAVWETGESDWPMFGEVDILEGVNDQGPNAMTLHTTANCSMPENREMTGVTTSTDCYWLSNFNEGCGVRVSKENSYGIEFNAAGGGWYAMERTGISIRVFFWSRHDPSVPLEVKFGGPVLDTNLWGVPDALFPNTECDISSHFGNNNIIINLTFCGDWAGSPSAYDSSGCPGSCIDYVNNNPSAFTDAYFDIAAIRVYQ